MERILGDTNEVLDLLGNRKAFIQETKELFALGDKGEAKLCVCSLTDGYFNALKESPYSP